MRHARLVAGCCAVLSMMALSESQVGATTGKESTSDYGAVAGRAAAGDLDAARVLRAAGPAGLSALLDAAVAGKGQGAVAASLAERPVLDSLTIDEHALDLVCAQVDCASSRLYWFTDFAAARREAERTGRPIVALRLLGRLDEELSCANSRYFRLVLYSDPAISGWLRDHAVLYWSSERPVPKVTVDYGDGRRLVGTVTGNSIHYMLDPHGRLVDAMPGLHTPKRFLMWLQGAGAMAQKWAPLADSAFAARSREEHERLDKELLAGLVRELTQSGWNEKAAWAAWGEPEPEEPRPRAVAVSAEQAAPLALSKSSAESPLLSALGRRPKQPLESRGVDALKLTRSWNVTLSAESRALVLARAPAAALENPDAALLRLEGRLAEDGLRNEAFLHRAIHQELARAAGLWSWEDLNLWVYADLFLTPASDPWLGLAPTELLGALLPVAATP
ncbi:MAG TPA: hypothetical protein VN923_02990 [Thermoanaerobaculia bacterium]|nr:hypothetical protein [Thermoanaerobaculia bacterium]